LAKPNFLNNFAARAFTLTSFVDGEPKKENFQIVSYPITVPIHKGQLFLQTIYISVDPYMRIKMSQSKSYTSPYEIGKPIYSAVLSKVLESKSDKFKVGDHVITETNCADFNIVDDHNAIKVEPRVPLDHAMSLFGMTGMTAYVGFVELAQPKAGETVLITAGGGAVGSKVAQLAKIHGCKVYCIVGDDKKKQFLTELGVDGVINYKKTQNLEAAIKELIPQQIDIFFDNVGGTQLDAALLNMKEHGRVIICGAISTYNAKENIGSRMNQSILFKRLKVQGFIVYDFKDRFTEFTEKLLNWYQQGKLKDKITVYEGLDNVVSAFIDLFSGKNIGKALVYLPE